MFRHLGLSIRHCGIAIALIGAPLQAQEPTPEATPEAGADEADSITVTGRRAASRADVSRQARDIALHDGNRRSNPLARFERPVCPGVMGMPEDLAEHLVGRIRYVAQIAGMDLAPENECRPNVLVAVVPDGREGLEQLERGLPAMFSRMSVRERRALLSASGPVHVVTANVERTRDGFEIPPREGQGAPPTLSVPLAFSRIYLTTRQDIEGVVILVEAGALDGLSIVQLADYAAMRGFAETQAPDGEIMAMDTILTLFSEGNTAPQSLTNFDLAYLRSLYDGIPNMSASSRLLGLNRQLRRMEDAPGIDRQGDDAGELE